MCAEIIMLLAGGLIYIADQRTLNAECPEALSASPSDLCTSLSTIWITEHAGTHRYLLCLLELLGINRTGFHSKVTKERCAILKKMWIKYYNLVVF